MRRLFKHIIFWLAVLVFYCSINCDEAKFAAQLSFNLLQLPFFMVAYYLLQYLLIPKLLNHKKYFGFSLLALTLGIAITLLHRYLEVYFIDPIFYPDFKPKFLTLTIFLSQLLKLFTPAVAVIAVKSHLDKMKEKDRLHALKEQRITTELKYLKAQLNPHFLFNTLNNLYSFVLNNSPKAPDMILRLSEILDYALYKSQEAFVPVSQEVKLIDNYLELEKIRYGERLNVNFNKHSDTLNSPITPLLLLSIVENAFKHGAGRGLESPEIKIDIKEEGSELNFNVWNTKPETSIQESNDAYKCGIGLKNIKRQLQLIYPNRHEVETNEGKDFFQLNLRINTLDHAS